ncbi:hypothetical protein IWX90DRAFT_433415 [Phyllosticta citrichinensis]|uniref:Uncharacterized protein n=1 Tax=Phyllosticta citrichinensis TaxID=1130410 RepID=A0ABR1XU72_9PEZI
MLPRNKSFRPRQTNERCFRSTRRLQNSETMRRSKPRLHLALYARPKHPDAPHYALLICPKNIPIPLARTTPSQSQSTQTPQALIHKHHVKNTLQVASDGSGATQPWVYEHARLASLHEEPRLLLTVAVGKLVESVDKVAAILERVPFCQGGGADDEGTQEFDCVEWVRRAVELLRETGAVSGLMEWDGVGEKAMAFLRREREGGRWDAGGDGERRIPVLELIGGAERVVA